MHSMTQVEIDETELGDPKNFIGSRLLRKNNRNNTEIIAQNIRPGPLHDEPISTSQHAAKPIDKNSCCDGSSFVDRSREFESFLIIPTVTDKASTFCRTSESH